MNKTPSLEPTKQQWREIIDDWNSQFPFLKRYGEYCLLYRTEIMAIGMNFEKNPEGYRPIIVIYSFWRNKKFKKNL